MALHATHRSLVNEPLSQESREYQTFDPTVVVGMYVPLMINPAADRNGRKRPKRDIPRSGGRSVKSFCAQFLPEGGSRHMLAFSPVKPGASLRRLDTWRVSHARGWV